MFLLLELMLAVGEGARISVNAGAAFDPRFAKFCLDFNLVVFRQNSSVAFESERVMIPLVIGVRGCPNRPRRELTRKEPLLVLHLIFQGPDLFVNLLVASFIYICRGNCGQISLLVLFLILLII